MKLPKFVVLKMNPHAHNEMHYFQVGVLREDAPNSIYFYTPAAADEIPEVKDLTARRALAMAENLPCSIELAALKCMTWNAIVDKEKNK